jgi:cytochrome c
MLASRWCGLAVPLALGATVPAAAQDVAAGQRLWSQCRACHSLEPGGRNGVGPNLHGVFGRRAGEVAGFRYSPAMKAKGEGGMIWTEETLRDYLADPRRAVPGGSMTFVGISDPRQVGDLLAYLREASVAAR